MEPRDWITLAIGIASLLSLGVAVTALVKTTKHNAEMREYASTAPEFGIANLITHARTALNAISQKMADIRKGKPEEKLTPTELRKLKDLEPAYFEACEALLNAFDRGCILYRDGSVNRDRFRRQYEVDIRQLFENGTDYYRKRLNDISSPFNALKAVFQEWFNRER